LRRNLMFELKNIIKNFGATNIMIIL